MMRTHLALLCALVFAGCGDRDEQLERPLDAGAQHALEHHVLWLQPAQQALTLLDVSRLRIDQIALGALPYSLHPSPSGQGALVLAQDAAIWVELGADGVETTRRYPIGAPFSQVSFSPSGERAVLHHAPGVSTGAVLTNPNQFAIIDLEAEASASNPVARTLKSFGAEPRKIYVGEPAEISGAQRQLAWALVDRYLAIFDLNAPEAEEVVVHLTLPEDSRRLEPTELQFNGVDGAFTAFARAANSDDIFSLTFPDSAPESIVPRPYLNQLPGGGAPRLLRVLAVNDGLRVFTLNASSIGVVHPQTGRRIVVPTGHDPEQMLPFEAARAEDASQTGHFALLWRAGERSVTFADLDQLEVRGSRALTRLQLDGPITALHPLPGRRAAVARVGESRLALLNFDDRTAAPLVAEGVIESLIIDPSGDRFYALVPDSDRAMFVVVDVDTGTPRSTLIEAAGGRLALVPSADRLVLDLQTEALDVVVINPNSLEVSYHNGLLLEGILDR